MERGKQETVRALFKVTNVCTKQGRHVGKEGGPLENGRYGSVDLPTSRSAGFALAGILGKEGEKWNGMKIEDSGEPETWKRWTGN